MSRLCFGRCMPCGLPFDAHHGIGNDGRQSTGGDVRRKRWRQVNREIVNEAMLQPL